MSRLNASSGRIRKQQNPEETDCACFYSIVLYIRLPSLFLHALRQVGAQTLEGVR